MFLGKTVYHYNRLMVAHIGKKLSTHTYYITPMTLNWFPWQPPTIDSLRQFSLKSLLPFSNLYTNYSVHGDETLCACVFHCFHDNRQQKMPSGTFPYNYFFTSQTCTP